MLLLRRSCYSGGQWGCGCDNGSPRNPGKNVDYEKLTGGYSGLSIRNLCVTDMLGIERRMGLYTSAIDQALKDLDYSWLVAAGVAWKGTIGCQSRYVMY